MTIDTININTAEELTHNQIRGQVSDEAKSIIVKLTQPQALRSVGLYALVYLTIGGLITTGVYIDNIYFTLLIVVLIAGRQHSLYILNHDASHYSLFKNKQLNKLVGTVLSNLVMFHHPEAWSFVQWRRVHVLHHKYLFKDLDPNYVGRKSKGDTEKSPLVTKLIWQVVSGGLLNICDLLLGRQEHVSEEKGGVISRGQYPHLLRLFMPYRDDVEMESERRLKIIFIIISLVTVHFLGVWTIFLLYWMLPMYTIYPMILRFHDLTEHRWEMNTESLQINTRTRKDGWLFKLLFTALPRGYHREHHVYPRVCVVDLAIVNQLLSREKLLPPPGEGVQGLFRELASNSTDSGKPATKL